MISNGVGWWSGCVGSAVHAAECGVAGGLEGDPVALNSFYSL